MSERIENLAERLEAIAEELAAAAIDELRSAIRRRDDGRPPLEKTLTQARRAVEKAVHLLRRADAGADGTDDADQP